MAESKPRDNDAVDGEISETADFTEALDEASDASPAPKSDKAPGASDKVAASTRAEKSTGTRGNPFARLSRFVREVVSELRKVIWPTRKELLTYTGVVVVFVTVMLTIVGSLDFGFAKAVLWVFGN